MFRKKAVNLPLVKHNFLQPIRAADFLFKASQMPAIPFEWVLVDKPQDGTIFIFQNQGPSIPDDGYGWLEDEIPLKHTLENGMEVEMFTRNLGFNNGDAFATMKRCRYRLVANPDLNLIHYVRIPLEAQKIPIQPSMIKVRPRQPNQIPAAGQQMQMNMLQQQQLKQQQFMQQQALQKQMMQSQNPQQLMQLQQQMMQNQQMKQQMYLQQQQFQQEQLRKRQKLAQAKQVPQVKVIDDEPPGYGDELDHTFGRVAALDRYKRNHLFMESIFSPINIEQIKPPKLFTDVSKERIELVKKCQAELEQEIAQIRKEFSEEMERSKRKSTNEWRNIRDVRFVV